MANPSLAFGALAKPVRKTAAQKHRPDRHAMNVRADVRRHVWKRSDVCEGCGMTERETAAKWPKAEHECNEIQMRSKTRGRKPEERFTTEQSCRLCVGCHDAFHKKRRPSLSFDFHTDEGMDGSYAAVWKQADGTFHIVPNPRFRMFGRPTVDGRRA